MNLPTEIFQNIIEYSDGRGVILLSMTCKNAYTSTSLEWWKRNLLSFLTEIENICKYQFPKPLDANRVYMTDELVNSWKLLHTMEIKIARYQKKTNKRKWNHHGVRRCQIFIENQVKNIERWMLKNMTHIIWRSGINVDLQWPTFIDASLVHKPGTRMYKKRSMY